MILRHFSRFRSSQGRPVALALLGALLPACSKHAPAPPAAPGPVPITAATPLVRPAVIWDRYIGRLAAVHYVEIRARVSGYLESIHFSEGQLVTPGDLLFVIDPRPFEAELARANATRAEAVARVAQAEAALVQSEAEQHATAAVLALAKSRLERAERAAESNAVAKETVDIRTSELLQADAALSASNARITAAKAAIETARAGIATADAAVRGAQIDLDFTRIEAPIAGRIGQRLVNQGNLVQGGAAGLTLLTTIVSLDPIHCYFDANEQEFLRYVRLAQSGTRQSSREVRNPIYMALQDEQGYPHAGHMDFVDNQLDPNTGTMRGRAIFPNPDGLLTPGLFATLRLPGSPRHDVVLVPDEAILTDQSERLVYVLGDGDVVERRVVALGPMIRGLRSITAGLSGSDRVVIRGLQRVRPGAVAAPTMETLTARDIDEGLPDDYVPVPKEKWLSIEPAAPATGSGDAR